MAGTHWPRPPAARVDVDDFKPVRSARDHQWTSDDPWTSSSARCEKCGLYLASQVDVSLTAPAAVLYVAGRYINGGLHLATRVRYDARKHGRCVS